MSTPNLSKSAQEVSVEISQFIRGMNAGRKLPRQIPELLAAAKETQFHFYNVGPWKQIRELGSAGTFFIPPCPAGADFIKAGFTVDKFVFEPYPENEQSFAYHQESGAHICNEILGVGMMHSPSDSFVPLGVFYCDSAKPTREQITEAKTALNKYLEELVNEANAAYMRGPKEAETVIQQPHRDAARLLKRTQAECPWLTVTNTATRQKCDGCGALVESSIIVCPTCRYVIDEARYEKNKARFLK